MLRALAYALRATHLIDRAYRRFSRLRSDLVLSWGSDAFYDVYNDVAYGSQKAYQPGSESFRTGFFYWEERAIERHFPRAPAHVLVGAAGGGREAVALTQRGYAITAFEPSRPLAISMQEQIGNDGRASVFVGRYEELPCVWRLDSSAGSVDLRTLGGFDAVVLGWASLSHLRSDEACISTLRQVAALSRGPILVSYFARPNPTRSEGFSVDLGYYREYSVEQVERFAREAGLTVVELDHESGWPNAVLKASKAAL